MESDRDEGYRMEPLATLPVFFKLSGRPVVLAGNGAPALWKAELLAAAGATVRVFDDNPSSGIARLAASRDNITVVGRRWTFDDLAGAALAVGDFADEAQAQSFRTAARTAGVPVNVIDKPEFCDFQFATIVSRSPLVIAISTDGAAPVFGQAIRARIEALLPQSLRAWAEAAKTWRPAVQAADLDFRRRRRFWERFAARALRSEREPTPDDRAFCFAEIDRSEAVVGAVELVGAGSGRPGDVTLDAVAALQAADIVAHDADVDLATVGLARREAAKMAVTDEIRARDQILQNVRQGRRLAWLGTGDPSRDTRWQVRATTLAEAGASVTLVRGLTG